ncbi:MAG: EAL domain-containing protein [Alteromonadaceae bacterium]|nr:EAL domain-containing protein [Alteromonadaceae bacterium]
MVPNRYACLDSVQKVLDKDNRLSLLLIDIVRFSDVSASLGYKAGDFILSEIARRIRTIFGEEVTLGRIGGDVFCVVFPGQSNPAQLQANYRRLNDHFKTPIAVGNSSFAADFNVGGVINPTDNDDVHKLFSGAESALKQAKSNKYDNFVLVNMQRKDESSRSLALKADLKRAFNNDELELFFQPKVDLTTLKIVGAECLLRWNHPLDGVLFPGPLIEAAESYNMMNQLGYWALQEAFKSSLLLSTHGYDIKLAVNVSPTQLYDEQFIPRLRELGNNLCVDPNLIELELTEDVAMSNSLMVNKQLMQARDMGMQIAIDDFGKGYSNLAYIRELSIDAIKIDKTFVMQLGENPVNVAIVKATKVIAEALGCQVVAEGIETQHHLHILQEVGVSAGQGFLFSKAVPMSEFLMLLNQDSGDLSLDNASSY